MKQTLTATQLKEYFTVANGDNLKLTAIEVIERILVLYTGGNNHAVEQDDYGQITIYTGLKEMPSGKVRAMRDSDFN